jgi:hypothetical protein
MDRQPLRLQSSGSGTWLRPVPELRRARSTLRLERPQCGSPACLCFSPSLVVFSLHISSSCLSARLSLLLPSLAVHQNAIFSCVLRARLSDRHCARREDDETCARNTPRVGQTPTRSQSRLAPIAQLLVPQRTLQQPLKPCALPLACQSAS